MASVPSSSASSMCSPINDSFSLVLKRVEEDLPFLKEKEAALRKRKRMKEQNVEKVSKNIKLVVGFEVFETTKDTLLRYPETVFEAMLGSDKCHLSKEGFYFIDRSPKHFDAILDFLRTGEVPTGEGEKIQEELEYYRLPVKEKKEGRKDGSVTKGETTNSSTMSDKEGTASTVVSIASVQEHVSRMSTLLQELADLEEQDKEWEEIMQEVGSGAKETIVQLNVGGRRFFPPLSLLTRMKGTYFSTMLEGGKWKPDAEGFYFIDRSPKYFPQILDYLRLGRVEKCEQLGCEEIQRLRIEFDYYLIPLPEDLTQVRWSPQLCSKGIQLSQNNRHAKCMACVASGVMSVLPVVKFKIQLLSYRYCLTIVGFAPFSADFGTNGQRPGWYLSADSGQLWLNGKIFQKGYCDPIKENSVVECRYEPHVQTISFSVDGVDKGVAFRDIPSDVNLHAAVFFCYEEQEVQLV